PPPPAALTSPAWRQHPEFTNGIHVGLDRRQVLVILARAAPPPDPTERAFYYPPARKPLEAPRQLGRLLARRHPAPAARPPHHLDRPPQRLLHPVLEAPLIGGIDPPVAQAGQRLGPMRDGCEQTLATSPVGHIGRMDQRLDHQPRRVHPQMALAPFHLLAPVESR